MQHCCLARNHTHALKGLLSTGFFSGAMEATWKLCKWLLFEPFLWLLCLLVRILLINWDFHDSIWMTIFAQSFSHLLVSLLALLLWLLCSLSTCMGYSRAMGRDQDQYPGVLMVLMSTADRQSLPQWICGAPLPWITTGKMMAVRAGPGWRLRGLYFLCCHAVFLHHVSSIIFVRNWEWRKIWLQSCTDLSEWYLLCFRMVLICIWGP